MRCLMTNRNLRSEGCDQLSLILALLCRDHGRMMSVIKSFGTDGHLI